MNKLFQIYYFVIMQSSAAGWHIWNSLFTCHLPQPKLEAIPAERHCSHTSLAAFKIISNQHLWVNNTQFLLLLLNWHLAASPMSALYTSGCQRWVPAVLSTFWFPAVVMQTWAWQCLNPHYIFCLTTVQLFLCFAHFETDRCITDPDMHIQCAFLACDNLS